MRRPQFYDFDLGYSQAADNLNTTEIMQLGPQATLVQTASVNNGQRVISQVAVYNSWDAIDDFWIPSSARTVVESIPDWPQSTIYHATQYGVGSDNPSDPTDLTNIQAARSVIAMFENTNFFQVRFALARCVSLSRNQTWSPVAQQHSALLIGWQVLYNWT